MTGTAPTVGWDEANRDHLVAELAALRLLLRDDATQEDRLQAQDTLAEARSRLPGESALDRAAAGFGLTGFERAVLLLAAGPDLVAAVAGELTAACGSAQLSFGAALALLPEAHWSALTPSAPLRRWGLVRLLDPASPTGSPLAVDERILHHLAGSGYLDAELSALARPVPAPPHLPGPLRRAAAAVAEAWGRHCAVLLSGPQPANLRAVGAAAAEQVGLQLLTVPAVELPGGAAERERMLRLMERETVLADRAWALELRYCADADAEGAARLVQALDAPVVLLGDEGAPVSGQGLAAVAVSRLEVADRRELLQSALRRADAPVDGVDAAAGVFDLSCEDAEIAARDAARGIPLWQACRERARPAFTGLARVLQPQAGWDDLVLPPAQTAQLRALVASVRHRATVLDDWGFAGRTVRDLGTTALFSGPSGTGKTLAAEVVAGDLGLDLVHVDLSQVMSKYIGETEKNLRRVFTAAEDSAAVLLFDEADALFGRRTEVRDSHDRYANLETGYLLQRLESFRGLAILTTNARSALDPAFTRRLRTVVHFPYPDTGMREALWRGVFPESTPVDGLDPAQLATTDLAGGGIASVALSAAYLAAAQQSPVTPEHVRAAARWELAKTGRAPLTGREP